MLLLTVSADAAAVEAPRTAAAMTIVEIRMNLSLSPLFGRKSPRD
jgi:hypothetical protein